MPIGLRLKLLDAVVTPTILYGCCSWAMTKARQQRLRATQRRMLRLIANSSIRYPKGDVTTEDYVDWIRTETRRTTDLMTMFKIKDWVRAQRAAQWVWAAKTASRTDERWSAIVAQWEPCNARRKGRPRLRWTDALSDFLDHKFQRKTPKMEWWQVAKDQRKWDDLMDEFCDFDPR